MSDELVDKEKVNIEDLENGILTFKWDLKKNLNLQIGDFLYFNIVENTENGRNTEFQFSFFMIVHIEQYVSPPEYDRKPHIYRFHLAGYSSDYVDSLDDSRYFNKVGTDHILNLWDYLVPSFEIREEGYITRDKY